MKDNDLLTPMQLWKKCVKVLFFAVSAVLFFFIFLPEYLPKGKERKEKKRKNNRTSQPEG